MQTHQKSLGKAASQTWNKNLLKQKFHKQQGCRGASPRPPVYYGNKYECYTQAYSSFPPALSNLTYIFMNNSLFAQWNSKHGQLTFLRQNKEERSCAMTSQENSYLSPHAWHLKHTFTDKYTACEQVGRSWNNLHFYALQSNIVPLSRYCNSESLEMWFWWMAEC